MIDLPFLRSNCAIEPARGRRDATRKRLDDYIDTHAEIKFEAASARGSPYNGTICNCIQRILSVPHLGTQLDSSHPQTREQRARSRCRSLNIYKRNTNESDYKIIEIATRAFTKTNEGSSHARRCKASPFLLQMRSLEQREVRLTLNPFGAGKASRINTEERDVESDGVRERGRSVYPIVETNLHIARGGATTVGNS